MRNPHPSNTRLGEFLSVAFPALAVMSLLVIFYG